MEEKIGRKTLAMSRNFQSSKAHLKNSTMRIKVKKEEVSRDRSSSITVSKFN